MQMTPEEFRKTVLPEARRLYAIAFRFLNNREESEDAVQEVMMKLWSDRNRHRDFASVAAWCTTVTRNYCIDLLRRKKRLKIEAFVDAGSFAASRYEETSAGDTGEAAGMVAAIVSRMKEPGRSAIIMRDMEGYSYEETAEAIGININALRTMISRARKMIRDEMNKLYRYGTGEDKRITR